jgi:MFS family permease
MRERGLRLRYYAYRVTTSWGLYLPVSVVYLLELDYGVGFVALTQAVFSGALLAAELPSGYLGDRIGRQRALALSSGLRTAGLGVYAVAEARTAFLAAQVLFGVSWAFASGTMDAWLYDLLAARGDADEFARVAGQGSTVELVVSAGGAVAGGVLFASAVWLPFAANATLAAAGLGVLAATPAVRGGRGTAADAAGEDEDADGSTPDRPGEDPLTVREAVDALRLQVHRPSVRWVVAYSVLLFVVFSLTRTFEQPALTAVGVPATGLGLLYAALKLVEAGAAATTGWFEDRLGARGTLALAAPVVAVAYGSLAVVPVAIVPVVFLYRAARTVLRPVRNGYLNERLADVGRATVLSGISMVLSLATVAARLATGPLAEVVGPAGVLAGAGVGLSVLAGALWLLTSPVRPVGGASGAGASASPGD